MIIDQGPVASLSLQRVLTDLCRRNFRTGVLAGFYFASAVAGEAEEREEMQHLNNHCRRVFFFTSIFLTEQCLQDIQIATISGNKNKELEEMLNIFKVIFFVSIIDCISTCKTHLEDQRMVNGTKGVANSPFLMTRTTSAMGEAPVRFQIRQTEMRKSKKKPRKRKMPTHI